MSRLLWKPTQQKITNSNMYKFMQSVNNRYDLQMTSYEQLHQWSIENIADFWQHFWQYADIQCSNTFDEILDDPNKMPYAKWFTGATLNFAQNLLRFRDDRLAIIFKGEDQSPVKITYARLYNEVAKVAKSLKNMGVEKGDRVVGFMPNMPETIIAMLAATSLGAVWSSCSPDFGIKGVLDRFGQIKPKVLFTANGYYFKGKQFNLFEKVSSIVKELPEIEKIIVTTYTDNGDDLSSLDKAVLFDEFKSKEENPEIEFEQLPFDHPLYIMFTSGTTGLPKCMVQSAGGILLHHLKELMLHTDLKPEDNIFYFTTCGWMMWNWLVSSLAVGASVVLFDGNPFHPEPGTLWELAQNEKITIFGTSAGYIHALMNTDIKPAKEYDLSPLRILLSTGSPLSEEGFDFVYEHIKRDLQLSSISGGSDINGCFALGNPMLPVYVGQLQSRALAMKVLAFDKKGCPVYDQKGELVCTAAFPSMPIGFWNDPDGDKYHRAYFDTYPGVWRHGDYIEIKSDTGGVIVYGRSDTTLNPGGVRIGTAEIYSQVERLDSIADSVVVGQKWKNDVRVILFVKMQPNHALTEELKNTIKQSIRNNVSPRHVPAKILPVAEIPYTINMKKVELAVKNIIEDNPVKNRDALANPETLDLYKNLPELQ
jgi:acetoacetyl-CoA synthetase